MADLTRQVDDAVDFSDSAEAGVFTAPVAHSVHAVGAISTSTSGAVYRYSGDGVTFSEPTYAAAFARYAIAGNNETGLILSSGSSPCPVALWDTDEWVNDTLTDSSFSIQHGIACGSDGRAWNVRYSTSDSNKLLRRSTSATWSDVTTGVPTGTFHMWAAHQGVDADECWITAWHVSTSVCAKLVRYASGSWAEVFVADSEFDDVPFGGYPGIGAYQHHWFDISVIDHPTEDEEVIWVCGKRDTKPVVCRWDGYTGVFTKPYESATSGQLNGIYARADDDVYAVGNSGLVIHWDGDSWDDISPGGAVTQNLQGIYGNAEGIWVCGEGGRIVSYNGEWNILTSGTSYNLYDIWVFAPNITRYGEASDTIDISDSAQAQIGAYPLVDPTDPEVSAVNVSKSSNIDMDITCNGVIADGWKVWVKIGDDDYELAFEHNGTPDFQPNWDGSASALTVISKGYHLTLDYTDTFPWFTTVYVKISVYDVLGHAGVLVN